MEIKPIITEKTTELAKAGKYAFQVGDKVTKHEIKKLIHELFGVDVTSVRTLKSHPEVKRSLSSRKKRFTKAGKKAIVTLKDKQKIDLFEPKKK